MPSAKHRRSRLRYERAIAASYAHASPGDENWATVRGFVGAHPILLGALAAYSVAWVFYVGWALNHDAKRVFIEFTIWTAPLTVMALVSLWYLGQSHFGSSPHTRKVFASIGSVWIAVVASAVGAVLTWG